MHNSTELSEIAEDMLKDVKKKAIKIGDEKIIEKVEEVISLCKNKEVAFAREAIKKINYTDLRAGLYLVVAIISREERDIEVLRRVADKQITKFGKIQTGFLILIAKLSKKPYDLERARQAIEKNNPFSQVHEYLILFMDFGQEQDLQKARQAARIEVLEKPFFKTAGLTIVAGFTGTVEDFQEMATALKGINEAELRQRIPADININSILEKSIDFKSATKAVDWIDDEYLRAKVWTIIGIRKMKWLSPNIVLRLFP